MKNKLFSRIYTEKKKKVNLSLDASLKARLEAQRDVDDVSISEQIESLYRSHRTSVEALSMSDSEFKRTRGERGKPMYGNEIRSTCGVFLSPDAIAFLDGQAKLKNSDRSKLIARSLEKILFKSE